MKKTLNTLVLASAILGAWLIAPAIAQNAGLFSSLAIGGRTSSFPAIMRNGSQLRIRAADDSAYVTLRAHSFFFNNGSSIDEPADGILRLVNVAGTSFSRLQFGGSTSSFPALKRSGSALIAQLADDSDLASFGALAFYPRAAAITPGSGTGITNLSAGIVQRAVYKAQIANTAFVCAATTCDVTIATLPAKTSVLGVFGELTTVFACSATCTSSTLSVILGTGGAGSSNLLLSFDADAATGVFGDVDAELGSVLARASAVQGGAITSFAGGTTVVVRLTSGTGNIGTGAVTNLSQGSITFYLVTERLP